MRENGIRARQKRRFRRTNDSEHSQPIAPTVLQCNFIAAAKSGVAHGRDPHVDCRGRALSRRHSLLEARGRSGCKRCKRHRACPGRVAGRSGRSVARPRARAALRRWQPVRQAGLPVRARSQQHHEERWTGSSSRPRTAMVGASGPSAIVSNPAHVLPEILIHKSKPPRSWPNATEGVRLRVCEDKGGHVCSTDTRPVRNFCHLLGRSTPAMRGKCGRPGALDAAGNSIARTTRARHAAIWGTRAGTTSVG
jgi:hypothetical protein